MKVAFVLIAAAVISGCELGNDATARGEIAELKRTLGPIQYAWLDPQLSFVVQKADFKPPETKYGQATVNYTINIKQNNAAFPLRRYLVNAFGSAIDSSGDKLASFSLSGTMDGGVLSVAEIDTLFGDRLDNLRPAELAALKLRVDNYQWSPERELKPYVESGAPR